MHSTTIHSNLIKKKKSNLILFYINGEDIIKMTFNIYIYHNWLTNLNISKNIKIIKYTPSFHRPHVTYYIKFKLLYIFIIIAFGFLIQV